MTNIGFIGLGHMGNPMAKNLLKAGYKLSVFDMLPASVNALVQVGAEAAISVAAMAANADIIFTSVQTGAQVRGLCQGDDGLFAHAKPDLLYIDCSSIDITTTRELHAEANKRGIAMLDAPVSGGVAGAAAATLTFMVGGTDAAFDRAYPTLQAMGKKIIHAGQAGHGQAAKICNNLLLGISMIGVSEAFTLADKLGLDMKKFFEISANASGQCWSMTSYCPVPGILEQSPSSHQYQPGFTANMMLKDLHLGQQAAETSHTALPLGQKAIELYETYVNQGQGDKDFSGIIQMIRALRSQ